MCYYVDIKKNIGAHMSTEFQEIITSNPGAIKRDRARALFESTSDEYKSWVKCEDFINFMESRYKETFLWHDYEAGSTHASSTQPLQFAAFRTDKHHNIIDVPSDFYCRPGGDKLIHPDAAKITNIDPLYCLKEGMPEPAFFRKIESEMTVPNTCVSGYNSMSYDEEVTRFGFWRNLLPVYPREYANFNSRFDLLPVAAVFYASGNSDIKWMKKEDGKVSLKLEHIAQANNIAQENAHNAVDDVKALIGVSAMFKESNPELWKYCFSMRRKKEIASQFYPGAVGVFVSPLIGADNSFAAPVLVLGQVPGESNKRLLVRLDKLDDLRTCWSASVEDIERRLYEKSNVLEENKECRPPLQVVAINKAPAFFPVQMADKIFPGLLSDEIMLSAERVFTAQKFVKKIMTVFSDEKDFPGLDPESSLYSAGFPSERDEKNILILKGQSIEGAFSQPLEWDNPMYHTMWLRARAKLDGYENITLSAKEKKVWSEHCKLSLQGGVPRALNNKDELTLAGIEELICQSGLSEGMEASYRKWISTLSVDLKA
jgi:exodeoxyribonuclease-1